MKHRTLLIVAALILLVSATAAFAEGNKAKSEVTVTGTVVSLSSPSADGKVSITVATPEKTYTITLSKEDIEALKLQEGKEITVKGIVENKGDQSNIELKVQTIEKDGKEYEVKEGKDVNENNDMNKEHETEKPEKHEKQESKHKSSGGDHCGGGNDD